MTATKLKKLYPVLWWHVYDQVMEDVDSVFPSAKKKQMDLIAHNAAFAACYEIHRLVTNLIGSLKSDN